MLRASAQRARRANAQPECQSYGSERIRHVKYIGKAVVGVTAHTHKHEETTLHHSLDSTSNSANTSEVEPCKNALRRAAGPASDVTTGCDHRKTDALAAATAAAVTIRPVEAGAWPWSLPTSPLQMASARPARTLIFARLTDAMCRHTNGNWRPLAQLAARNRRVTRARWPERSD